MKKAVVLIIALVLCLTGCFTYGSYTWEFEQDASNVKEIKIIDATSEYSYSVIQDIDVELADELYNDITSLEMKRYGTNLSHPNNLCFLVVFENGEYDIVSSREPKHCRYNEEFDKIMPHNSWLCCDQEEFDALINKYLEMSDSSVYSDEALQQMIDCDLMLNDFKAKYPSDYESKLNGFVEILCYGDSSVAVVYFDSEGTKTLSRLYDTAHSKDVYEQLEIGQSLSEVQELDPDGPYLFLHTGVDEPRNSTHYTNDKHVVYITYDESFCISEITINSVQG